MVTVFMFASMPVTAEVQSATVTAGSFREVKVSLDQGDEFVFTLISTDYPINVYLTDNENFYEFEDSEPFVTYSGCTLKDAMSGTFSFVSPEDGVYHLILSNRNGFEDAHIEYESYSTVGDDIPGFTLPIMISAVFISVGIFTVMRRRK